MKKLNLSTRGRYILVISTAMALILLSSILLYISSNVSSTGQEEGAPETATGSQLAADASGYEPEHSSPPEPEQSIEPDSDPDPDSDPEPEPEPEPDPEPEPEPMPWELFFPYFVEETNPFSPAINYSYNIQADGEIVDEYLNPDAIFFGMPDDYSDVIGVTTFRGDNFRNRASHGTAVITEEKLTEIYRFNTGSLHTWTGVGWSGQPAIIKWDYDVQQQMNLLPGKLEKEGLVEVIQGATDGYVYFFDLENGEPTRSRLWFGEPIKGGVTVDPRGYPLLYIGQGDVFTGVGGYYIYSLLDFTQMFFLNGTDRFAYRSSRAFDSNPLFDIPNDRMILCGENGVIYNIKLNTDYNRAEGTLTIEPEVVRYRYRTNMNISRQYGIESSPAMFSRYIFTADNGGTVQCVDLMTFTPVWARDCTDDTDASVVLDWEEDNQLLALYTGSQSDYQPYAYIRKLNAENGELLWEYAYPCITDRQISGGVLATPVAGKEDMSHLVIFWVGKLRNMGGGGALVAFDKYSGEVVWEHIRPAYGWSSPVAVYTEDGRGYIVVCDSAGRMILVRGATGEILDTANIGGNAEASPAVFGNMIVVGTRSQLVFGIEIS